VSLFSLQEIAQVLHEELRNATHFTSRSRKIIKIIKNLGKSRVYCVWQTVGSFCDGVVTVSYAAGELRWTAFLFRLGWARNDNCQWYPVF